MLASAFVVAMIPWSSFALLEDSAALVRASEDDAPRIYGGQETETCEFPSAVFANMYCTGTLVHPQVVISAGHCAQGGSNFQYFLFGEHKNSAARRANIKWCESVGFEGTDAAICVLEEAMTDVPIAPILQGCETEILKTGTKVVLSGFGYAQNESAGGPPEGQKRWVETDIKSVSSSEVQIGGGGTGGCNGDSGGPAFVQLEDGTWRTFGYTHGGDKHPNCDVGIWKLAHAVLPWYEEQLAAHGEDIDLTPCFDDAGDWSPNEHCGGYPTDIKGPYCSWDNGCSEGVPVVEFSATCGPPFMEPDDEAPVVTIDSPDDGDIFDPDEVIDVTVQASDNVGVVEVELYVDGASQGTVSDEPYEWMLELDEGSYEIHAIARDAAGLEGESSTIEIEVALPEDPSEDTSEDPSEESSGDTTESESTEEDSDSDSDGSDDGSDTSD